MKTTYTWQQVNSGGLIYVCYQRKQSLTRDCRPNMIFMCLMGVTSLGTSVYVTSKNSVTLSKCLMSRAWTILQTSAATTRILHGSSRVRRCQSPSNHNGGPRTEKRKSWLDLPFIGLSWNWLIVWLWLFEITSIIV